MEVLEKTAVAGRQVTLTEARTWVNDYAEKSDGDAIRSLTISADHLRRILAQPDCEFVRFFVALTQPEKASTIGLPAGHSLVAIGVDSDDNLIKKSEFDTLIFEDFTTCPPTCNFSYSSTHI